VWSACTRACGPFVGFPLRVIGAKTFGISSSSTHCPSCCCCCCRRNTNGVVFSLGTAPKRTLSCHPGISRALLSLSARRRHTTLRQSSSPATTSIHHTVHHLIPNKALGPIFSRRAAVGAPRRRPSATDRRPSGDSTISSCCGLMGTPPRVMTRRCSLWGSQWVFCRQMVCSSHKCRRTDAAPGNNPVISCTVLRCPASKERVLSFGYHVSEDST